MDKTQWMKWVVVDAATGCHIWQRKRNHEGYGTIPHRGRNTYPAHRFAYEEFIGPIGDRLVLHRCDVRPCVNPEHLYAGTHADNVRDIIERDRAYRGGSRTKLNWGSVCAIREAAAAGASHRALARQYSVNIKTLKQVVNRVTWNSEVRTRRLRTNTPPPPSFELAQ